MRLKTGPVVMGKPELSEVTPQERIKQLEAERDRLREALEALMKSTGALYNSPYADNEAESLARAVLEGK
jgi:hypothetical protein